MRFQKEALSAIIRSMERLPRRERRSKSSMWGT